MIYFVPPHLFTIHGLKGKEGVVKKVTFSESSSSSSDAASLRKFNTGL